MKRIRDRSNLKQFRRRRKSAGSVADVAGMNWPPTRRGETVSAKCHDGHWRDVVLSNRIGKVNWNADYYGFEHRYEIQGRARYHERSGTFTFTVQDDVEFPKPTVEERLCRAWS